MAFAERAGVKLAYEATGEGDPPLVFVHGWCCDRSYFAPQAEHFSQHHRVVSLDLRGHGQSDQPDDGYEVEEFARDVVAVSAEAGLVRPVVVGHSLGGLVALTVAAMGEASAAVLVDPAPLVPDPETRAAIESVAARCAKDVDGTWRARFVDAMFLASDVARRTETIAGMSRRPPHIASPAILGIATFDGPAALRACQVPLLVINAASGNHTTELLGEHCPKVTVGQTVGAGHFNQLEVPEQVNAMIEQFLRVNQLR